MEAIVKAYARRIKRGAITIDDVPEPIREQVADLIKDASE